MLISLIASLAIAVAGAAYNGTDTGFAAWKNPAAVCGPADGEPATASMTLETPWSKSLCTKAHDFGSIDPSGHYWVTVSVTARIKPGSGYWAGCSIRGLHNEQGGLSVPVDGVALLTTSWGTYEWTASYPILGSEIDSDAFGADFGTFLAADQGATVEVDQITINIVKDD